MAWHTFDLRGEIHAEFAHFCNGELYRCHDSPRLYTDIRHYYRRVWNRPPVQCRTCGVVFTPVDQRRVYCSRQCLQRYHASLSHRAWQDRRAAARLAARADRVCANPRCRVVFTGRRSDSLYCLPACRDRCRALRAYYRTSAKAEPWTT